MKRRELEEYLRSVGCVFHRNGAAHDIWRNPANGKKGVVPRHAAIPRGTVRSICRQLGIPLPPNL